MRGEGGKGRRAEEGGREGVRVRGRGKEGEERGEWRGEDKGGRECEGVVTIDLG